MSTDNDIGINATINNSLSDYIVDQVLHVIVYPPESGMKGTGQITPGSVYYIEPFQKPTIMT